MTTETILTDEDLKDQKINLGVTAPDEFFNNVARTIEQAVLQSPEIQALRKDAARLDWLESSEASHGFCHEGYGDFTYYAHQLAGYKTVREVIDAAMEQQI